MEKIEIKNTEDGINKEDITKLLDAELISLGQELSSEGGPTLLLKKIEIMKDAHKFEGMSAIDMNLVMNMLNMIKDTGTMPINYLKNIPERIRLNNLKRKAEKAGMM